MSPLVGTLIDCERLVKKKSNIFYQTAAKADDSFLLAVYDFLWTRTVFAFFRSVENFSLSMHDSDIQS